MLEIAVTSKKKPLTAVDTVLESVRQALDDALRGDLRALGQMRDTLSGSDGALVAESWRTAVDAVLFLTGDPRGRAPTLDALRPGAGSDPEAAAFAAGIMTLTAVAKFDARRLDELEKIGQSWTAPGNPAAALPAVALRWRSVSMWLSLARGELDALGEQAKETEQVAGRLGVRTLVIECAVLRALAAAGRWDIETAVADARRAARMAATEELPQQEYLSSLVLARTRRLSGAAHHAAHILAALRRYAPALWHDAIDWELVMAGGAAPEKPSEPALVHVLLALRQAARSGGRVEFERAAAELAGRVTAWSPLASDLGLVRATIEPLTLVGQAPAPVAPEVERWRHGGQDRAPYGIESFANDQNVDSGEPVAYVLGFPDGRPARRFLGAAAALAATETGALRLPPTKRPYGRSDALLSVLALAGPDGLAEADVFLSVYGFRYARGVHKDVFNVLLHRARARLGGAGEVDRGDSKMTLRLSTPLLIPDPRCTGRTDNRVLRFIAQRGSASAHEIAGALSVPLRTAQAAIESLVTDGVCHVRRSGRHIEYLVQDTTFQVPTRFR